MSSGVFTAGFYQTDDGEILNARYQPETIIAGVNPAVSGPATFGISANLSGSMKKNGVNARRVYGKWLTAPAGYLAGGRVVLPILEGAAYDAIDKGDEITYLGGSFRVTGKVSERLV